MVAIFSQMYDFDRQLIGEKFENKTNIDNSIIDKINNQTANHPIEIIGRTLRLSMTEMKNLF